MNVSSWNVAGLSEELTDAFLSQISMLRNWDVLLLQECFRKLDGVNVRANLWEDCDARQSLSIKSGMDKRKLLEVRADGLRSSWMDR